MNKGILPLIPEIYDKHINGKWDTIWYVTGAPGTGKSYAMLYVIEAWYRLHRGQCVKEDICHMCMTIEEFAKDLADLNKYECTVFDEAAELSSRRAMSNENVRVTNTFKIVRGDSLFVLLVAPSIKDIDSAFDNLIKGVIHMQKRQRFKFWPRDTAHRVAAGVRKHGPSYINYLRAPYHGYVPKYKGVLLEAYEAKKNKKMKSLRAELYDNIMKRKKGRSDLDRSMIAEYAGLHGAKRAAEMYGYSERQIYNILREFRRLKTQA